MSDRDVLAQQTSEVILEAAGKTNTLRWFSTLPFGLETRFPSRNVGAFVGAIVSSSLRQISFAKPFRERILTP